MGHLSSLKTDQKANATHMRENKDNAIAVCIGSQTRHERLAPKKEKRPREITEPRAVL